MCEESVKKGKGARAKDQRFASGGGTPKDGHSEEPKEIAVQKAALSASYKKMGGKSREKGPQWQIIQKKMLCGCWDGPTGKDGEH